MGRSANNFDINSKFHNLGVLPLDVTTPVYRYRLTFHEELGLGEPMFYRSSVQLFCKEVLFPDPGRSCLWIWIEMINVRMQRRRQTDHDRGGKMMAGEPVSL